MTDDEIVAFYLDATRDLLTNAEAKELALLCLARMRKQFEKEIEVIHLDHKEEMTRYDD